MVPLEFGEEAGTTIEATGEVSQYRGFKAVREAIQVESGGEKVPQVTNEGWTNGRPTLLPLLRL